MTAFEIIDSFVAEMAANGHKVEAIRVSEGTFGRLCYEGLTREKVEADEASCGESVIVHCAAGDVEVWHHLDEDFEVKPPLQSFPDPGGTKYEVGPDGKPVQVERSHGMAYADGTPVMAYTDGTQVPNIGPGISAGQLETLRTRYRDLVEVTKSAERLLGAMRDRDWREPEASAAGALREAVEKVNT
jgi:hypothetical protein